MVVLTSAALGFLVNACVPNSGGCGGDTGCTQALQPGSDQQCTVDGRSFYVYAPANYDPSQPTALIVDAHGAMESAESHTGLDTEFCANGMCWPGKGSGWRLEADMPTGGFIVLTPQGTNNRWVQNDESFILAAVDKVKSIANIDSDKVFISGISNGAALSYWVGVPNSDVFSGMSPVAGGSFSAIRSIDNPMPVISFDAKPDFAYSGNVSSTEDMVDVNNCNPRADQNWLTIDSNYDEPVCRDDQHSTDPTLVPCSAVSGGIEPTVCKRWTECDGGVTVVFCDVTPSNTHGAANAASDAHILYQNDSHLNLPSVAWRFFNGTLSGN